ncbi:hypothetical protein [Stenotrophomonas sp.]|uniref:hypothetical protein n=1 Tax=Stenotrophomonas sp. TaxID=69392 RepID=UPI0028AFF1E9|nr:hypothetical protein [Stenotrophomonas sp.]
MHKPAPSAFLSTVLRRCARSVRLVAAAVLLAGSGAVAAESLTTVAAGNLPALPTQIAPGGLVHVDGRLVALGHDGAWELRADNKAWDALPAPAAGQLDGLEGSVSAAGRTYLLQGRDALGDRLQPVVLNNGALVFGAAIALPEPLRNARAATFGDALYLVGTDAAGSAQLYRRPAAAGTATWQHLEDLPQQGVASALQAQKGALYLGLATSAGSDQLWRRNVDASWQQVASPDGTIVAGSMRALGQAHLLMLVKDGSGMTQARTFHTITDAWTTLDTPIPAAPQAVTAWGNGLAWASAGATGSQLQYAELQGGKHLLRWLDWTVIGIYLLAMLGMGFYFYLKDQNASTADFFVGGRSIPFWAAGISL